LNVTRPNQDQVGRVTFKKLCADPRLRILQTDQVDNLASRAALQAALGEAQQISAALLEAKTRIAELEAALAEANSKLKAAQETAHLPAPSPAAPSEDAPGEAPTEGAPAAKTRRARAEQADGGK
jgi:hypothetical protein